VDAVKSDGNGSGDFLRGGKETDAIRDRAVNYTMAIGATGRVRKRYPHLIERPLQVWRQAER